jgi:hypothetical protein
MSDFRKIGGLEASWIILSSSTPSTFCAVQSPVMMGSTKQYSERSSVSGCLFCPAQPHAGRL